MRTLFIIGILLIGFTSTVGCGSKEPAKEPAKDAPEKKRKGSGFSMNRGSGTTTVDTCSLAHPVLANR